VTLANVRRQRGMELAARFQIVPEDDIWLVPSSSSSRTYRVDPVSRTCNCDDYELTQKDCKHIFAAEFARERQFRGKEIPIPRRREGSQAKRKTYPQNWAVYNAAQNIEKPYFKVLLKDLCDSVEQIEQKGRSRPRMSTSDAIYSCVYKVFATVSSRRFAPDIIDACDDGFVSESPHFNTISNYLRMEETTAILTKLIEESGKPLNVLESSFSIDSTGIGTTRYSRWFDAKFNNVGGEKNWVKLHLICGNRTHIVTSVEIHEQATHDSPVLPSLLQSTAKNFKVDHLCADKAYSSRENMEAAESVGAVPYFAFKTNSTGGKGGIFKKMFHYYSYRREEFLEHYHQRSNVETVFHMIKSKFGDQVKSKSQTAMKNEVLCKVLCHNICRVIHAIHEHGIEIDYLVGGGESNRVTLRKAG
jgi:Transposase DDE domain/SWIM zinc finger